MIKIKDKKNCCGCSACFNICPKNAIEMKSDDKGFDYPVVNEKKCIKCGLCEKICPILNKIQDKKNDIIAYACYNKNEEQRLLSSSGGVFVLIAEAIIDMDGVVFGASFDNNFHVNHILIDKKEDLHKLMTSKYVQSKISNTYRQVKDFLNNDKIVLFTGTPCQIEGLKAYLQKDYEKLYTQDIICHGVPSSKIWDLYLKYRKKSDGQSPVHINFRNKENGWSLYALLLQYNNSAYKQDHHNDLYMQAFLRNTCLRDSCYACNFKKENRNSDITLGDYWGINNIHPNFNDDKGISLILLHTEKGRYLFNLIKSKIIYINTDWKKAIEYNPAYIKSAEVDPKRDLFFKNLNNEDFENLIKKYTSTYQGRNIVKRIYHKVKKILIKR